MPDPESYDKFTKTGTLVDLESEEASAAGVDAVDMEEGSAPGVDIEDGSAPGVDMEEGSAPGVDVSATGFEVSASATVEDTDGGEMSYSHQSTSNSMNGTEDDTTEPGKKGVGKTITDGIGKTGKAIGSGIGSGAGAIKNVFTKKPVVDTEAVVLDDEAAF